MVHNIARNLVQAGALAVEQHVVRAEALDEADQGVDADRGEVRPRPAAHLRHLLPKGPVPMVCAHPLTTRRASPLSLAAFSNVVNAFSLSFSLKYL